MGQSQTKAPMHYVLGPMDTPQELVRHYQKRVAAT